MDMFHGQCLDEFLGHLQKDVLASSYRAINLHRNIKDIRFKLFGHGHVSFYHRVGFEGLFTKKLVK